MNQAITPYQRTLPSFNSERSIKLLLFSVGSLPVTLPVSSVQKVINHIPVHGSGLSAFGVANIDDRQITVIDLEKKLLNIHHSTSAVLKGYLILARDSLGESFGIWVGEAPSLIDVPLSKLRVLPESYRRSDTLAIASHVMILSQQETSMTVFLLDVDRLLDRV